MSRNSKRRKPSWRPGGPPEPWRPDGFDPSREARSRVPGGPGRRRPDHPHARPPAPTEAASPRDRARTARGPPPFHPISSGLPPAQDAPRPKGRQPPPDHRKSRKGPLGGPEPAGPLIPAGRPLRAFHGRRAPQVPGLARIVRVRTCNRAGSRRPGAALAACNRWGQGPSPPPGRLARRLALLTCFPADAGPGRKPPARLSSPPSHEGSSRPLTLQESLSSGPSAPLRP